jgi:uncharacterized protein (TIGR02996 family)
MNEAAFLSALCEDANDEVTWLALADWLEEDGQGQRAELVRLVRQLRTVPLMARIKRRAALEARVAQLLVGGVRPAVPEITNSIGMRLALMPPGNFRMGSPTSESKRTADETPHKVTLSRPFYLGVHLVTQRQFQQVMRSNPSRFHPGGAGKELVAGLDTSDFPVESITWEETEEFCRRLNAAERKARPGWSYRLPTEAEWEYGCRGGSASTGPFSFGEPISSTLANFDGSDSYGLGKLGPSLRRPSAVGSYPPNVFGLYDMHGNVWEWCHDWYDHVGTTAVTDPQGPPDGRGRVCKGGSWAYGWQCCRSSSRCGTTTTLRSHILGFRVALVEDSAHPAKKGASDV